MTDNDSPSLTYNEMCLVGELIQLWMAVQLSVRMGSFLNVTTVAAVDLRVHLNRSRKTQANKCRDDNKRRGSI